MKLKTLTLSYFRNFTERSIDLSQPLSFIQGHNGSGKTAILEALVLIFYGRSFRTHQPKHLIQEGRSFCRVILEGESFAGEPILIGLQKNLQGETLIKLNKVTLTSHLPLTKLLPVNILHPEMTEALLSDRLSRRQLIDWSLFYLDPAFIGHWQRYQRILKQRNAALKSDALWVWDEALIEAGEEIHRAREKYSHTLAETLREIDPEFCALEDLTVKYYPGWPRGLSLREALVQHHTQDREVGYTLIGPHRADLVLKSHQLPIKTRLSRGQLKKAIWALKLAQSMTLKHQNISALTLIDDLAAELDSVYQQKLFEIAQQLPGQLILTGIREPDYFSEEKNTIDLN